jgi:hypothetical protein
LVVCLTGWNWEYITTSNERTANETDCVGSEIPIFSSIAHSVSFAGLLDRGFIFVSLFVPYFFFFFGISRYHGTAQRSAFALLRTGAFSMHASSSHTWRLGMSGF